MYSIISSINYLNDLYSIVLNYQTFVGEDEGDFCEPIPEPPTPDQSCKLYEFKCADGKCISHDKVCNGRDDCRNGDDEADFCPTAPPKPEGPKCGRNEFMCDNGECINYRFVCDGVWNCRKGEDEAKFCLPHKTPPVPECEMDEFMCSDGLCVKLHKLCDEFYDCADGADEGRFCTVIDQCKGFMCRDDSRCLRYFLITSY